MTDEKVAVIRIEYPDGEETLVMDGTNSDWIVLGVFPSCPGPADPNARKCDCKGGHKVVTELKSSPMVAAHMIHHLFDQCPDVLHCVASLMEHKIETARLLGSKPASKETH